MEPKQVLTNVATFLPSPKTARGYPSSLDISQNRLLYFNSSVAVISQLTKPPIILYHSSVVTAASFSRDGKFVASSDSEGKLLIHTILEDKAALTKSIDFCFSGNVKCIAWSTDNKTVVVVGEGKNVFGRIINLESGYAQGDISQVSKNLLTAAVRSDKPLALCVAGEESSLKFYEGSPCLFIKSENQHTNFTNQIKYSPDGQYLVSVSSDKKIVLYDAKTTSLLRAKQNAHEAGIMGVDWIGSDKLVTCSNDKLIKIWSLEFEELKVLKIRDNPTLDDFQVAVRSSGEDIYSVSLNGNINHFKQPLTDNSSLPTDIYEGLSGQPVRLLVDSNNSTFYVIDSTGRVFYYNKEGNRLSTFKNTSDTKMFFKGDLAQPWLYVLTGDGFVRKYDVSSKTQKQCKQRFRSEEKVGNYLAIAADPQDPESYVLAGDRNLTIFKNGARKDIKNDHESHSVRFGANGVIAIGTIKGQVVIYSGDLTQLHTFKSSSVKITELRFDNQTLYVGDSSKMINLWNWKAEKASELNIGFHTGLVYDICIGSKVIVSGGVDNKVIISDKLKQERLLELPHHHKRGVMGVGILNNCLVTTGGDMLVRMVRLEAFAEL